jgi:hypothetical protein
MNELGAATAQPVVMRLSPMAKANYLAAPGTVGFFLLFFGFAVPTIPGKLVGVISIAGIEYLIFRFLFRRLAHVRATLTDQDLQVCNKARSNATFDIPWSEVASVDRGWRYYGSPLGLRGSMLTVSPRPGLAWSRVYVFASYGATSRTCEPVVASLRAAAATHGFAVSARIGNRYGFTRPGRGWWSRKRSRGRDAE